jgi:oxalate decarboxylase/phosphoglucose isomerase-like protein (cupin superfamily)
MEMKKVKIQNLKPELVKGVEVVLPQNNAYRETYFEWKETALTAEFATHNVSGGTLQAWYHQPLFKEAENHIDAEMFYFISGTALMMFIDYKKGKPDLKTAQVVRILPGTKIIIAKGKGHFVPVAEGNDPVSVVVVAPKMDAPRVALSEPILGII